MMCLKLITSTASKVVCPSKMASLANLPLRMPFQIQPFSDSSIEKVTHRKRSPCEVCVFPPDRKPCFDIRDVTIERGNNSHANQIRSFLYTEFWPREPSVVGLWMCLNCPYLEILTEKYANSGDRLLALERIKRTGEQKLVGVSVSDKVFPWAADELEEWAHHTMSTPERNRMYFSAHCIRSPNLFQKYNVDFIYEVEVLATAAEVSAQGVGTALLRTALAHAEELRYPLVQVIAVSQYTSRICEKCGMKREWSMDYSEFVDDAGQRVFFPRRPHHTVSIYTTHYNPALGYREPCKPPFL